MFYNIFHCFFFMCFLLYLCIVKFNYIMVQSTAYLRTLAYRCANPANIRYVETNSWKGLVGSENGFCKFEREVYGVRALIRTLRTYVVHHHLCTVSSIISRFAPPSENDTQSYIDYVCKMMIPKVYPNKILFHDDSFKLECYERLYELCRVICLRESHYRLSLSLFLEALTMC